jgi:hypothetical protein
MIERDPERPELRLVPPRADPEDQPAAADLVHGGGHLGDHARGVECQAGHEGPEVDPLGDRCEPGEKGPGLPRPALGTPVTSVQQVVAQPHRVEPRRLGGSSHGHVLGPPDVPLDFGELDPNSERARHVGRSTERPVGLLPAGPSHQAASLPRPYWTAR